MENYQEKLILKACLENSFFSSLFYNVFSKSIFDNPYISDIISVSLDYHSKYKNLPSKDIILEELKNKDDIEKYKDVIQKSLNLDIRLSDDSDSDVSYVIDETEKYVKRQLLKGAVVDSVDIIGEDDEKDLEEKDYETIKEKIEKALTSSLKREIGLNYFNDMSERLKRVFDAENTKIPTFYPIFDEFTNGGIGKYSLSVILGKIHGFKSGLMANLASRQVLNGKNVLIFTLEMSEDNYAQRHDAIFASMDINRMYASRTNRQQLMKQLIELKKDETRGTLFLKQYPTGDASVNDFKIYLHEMDMRGYKFDIIYVDYMNLMKPVKSASKGDMYTNVKRISEELRAMSYEFNGIPIISGSQLNREGSFTEFNNVDMFYTSECLDPSILVEKESGEKVKIKNIEKNDRIKGSHGYVNVKGKWIKKKKKYRIKTKSGKEIICSIDHNFPTKNGIKSIRDGLNVGDKLYSES